MKIATLIRPRGLAGVLAMMLGPVAMQADAPSQPKSKVTHANQSHLRAEPAAFSLTKVAESRVDRCVTIKGPWGTFINGKSYQQSPLDTFNGWQYATYYDQERRLSLARRQLPDGVWEHIHFDDYTYEGDDNHNVSVLGICPKDGTIHLAFDHHGHPLNYRVSKAGMATRPEQAAWTAASFSAVRDWLKEGQRIERVTYPRFLRTPEGNLLFVRRHGVHFDGRIWFCEYDPAQGGWSEQWQVTSSTGDYVFRGMTNENRNAYLNGVDFDFKTGRLHMSWHWRGRFEGAEGGLGQYDLNYTWSDDRGRTWFNSAAEQIGGPEQLVSIKSPGLAVWNISPARGVRNQMGQCVDAAGRPHILTWHLPDGEPDLRLGRRNPSRSAFHHYWQDGEGTWQRRLLPQPVDDSDRARARPAILATAENHLVAMFNFRGKLVLCGATEKTGYRDWTTLLVVEGPWDGEPLPDVSRFREEGILSIYMQREPTQDREPTDLYVLDFCLGPDGSTKPH